MDPNKVFAIDPALANDGKWFDYRDGSRVRVARLNNDKFRKIVRMKLKPYGMVRNVPDQVMDDVTCRAMAESILLGWDGFTSNGQPLTYSTETAHQLLKALPDFRDEISQFATAFEEYVKEGQEEQEKNSPHA